MANNFCELLKHPRIKFLVTAEALLICLIAAPQVAEAYFIQLAQPHPPVEMTDSLNPFANAKPLGRSALNESGEVVPHEMLLKNLLTSAADQDRRLMLWSVYPASVRGRVFGGVGGDPMATGLGGW